MRPARLPTPLGLPLKLALVVLWSLLLVPPVTIMAGGDSKFQDLPITYLRYDVDITLKPDGNFVVREIQQVHFDGQYRTAFAEIPRDYASDIRNLQVWVDDIPYTQSRSAREVGMYALDVEASAIYVDWRYEETSPGDVRTFILQYEVVGGLWVYPDETTLEWRAVPSDRSGFPVLGSQVTINLPAEVPADELRYTAYGPEFTAEVVGSQVFFRATEAIPDGVRFQVQMGFPPGLTAAEVQPWQIAEDTAELEYRLEAMDVDLVIDLDGRVTVTEHQRVAVDAGALYSSYRSISLAYLDDIADLKLFEGDQQFSLDRSACEAYCFQVDKQRRYRREWIRYHEEDRSVRVVEALAGEVDVSWEYPVLVKGEATTFHLQYKALGAIHLTEDSQRLNWTVVYSGRDLPVQSASVRIELPPGITWEDVTLQGGQMRVKPDGSISLVHEGPISRQATWQISLTMPAGATGATKPAWQQALEAAEAEARRAEIRRARQQLGAGVGGAFILVVGLMAALLAWSAWGRDRPTETVAEYFSQPPSDLPPGIVAYLVDEEPTPKGVLASLFNLASLGLLRIDLADQRLLLQCNWGENLVEGQALQIPSGETVTVPGHLVTLFNSLRPAIPVEKTTPLSRVSQEFKKALPMVYVEMAQEASRFFTERPAAARHRWVSIGQWLVLAGIAGTVGAWFAFRPDLGPIALAPTGALIPVGLVFMLVSRWMPQRTAVGVEEAARWRAFRHYLRNLKRYHGLVEAQKILDDYFAYVVALDVEEVVLKQAEEVGGVMPAWTYPMRLELGQELQDMAIGPEPPSQEPAPGTRPRRPLLVTRDWSGEGPRETLAGTVSDHASTRLSLQGLSGQLGRTLSNASNSIGRLLGTAVGGSQGDTPFILVLKGTGKAVEMTWDATTATMKVVGDILEESSSGGGSGGHGGSSSRSSSTRWSSSSSRGSSSRGFSGRSSSSRRSGGGGRRGFG